MLAAAWRAWLRNTPCRSRFPERDAIYGEIRAVRDEPMHGPFDGFGHILRPIDGPGDHPNSEPVRRSNIVRGQLRDDSVSFTPASRRSTGSIDGLRSARSGNREPDPLLRFRRSVSQSPKRIKATERDVVVWEDALPALGSG